MEPYEGREPYIFISYARKDAERVLPYLDALSGADYRVWYDKGISAGDEWLKKLEEKVTNCAVFCPIFSQAFNDSYYCFRETGYACWRDKKIVPLYLEEVGENLRLMFRLLKSLQHLRLDDCNPAQFAERLDGQPAFEDCKAPHNAPPEGWQKVGEIWWRLSADGVLMIMGNNLFLHGIGASIPAYQLDSVHLTTAPWAPYREKILSVKIADNIYAIGDHAFHGCANLTKAFIGNSVTRIAPYAFSGCKSLTNVRIPDSVTKIGKSAFSHCASLTDVRIPNGVTEIGIGTFLGCESLTNVRIPDSVTTIGYYAFWDCKNLKKVEIPAGLEIDEYTFSAHTLVTRRKAP